MRPRKGLIGYCNYTRPGLITGRKDGTWVGVHLTAHLFGRPWQAKNPTIVNKQRARQILENLALEY